MFVGGMVSELGRRTRRATNFDRGLSPEYFTRRHSTKWNFLLYHTQIRISQGVGHGNQHGGEARQESAAAETGGGAEAPGRGSGGKPARPCTAGGQRAHSTLLPHRIRIRRRHRDAGSAARR